MPPLAAAASRAAPHGLAEAARVPLTRPATQGSGPLLRYVSQAAAADDQQRRRRRWLHRRGSAGRRGSAVAAAELGALRALARLAPERPRVASAGEPRPQPLSEGESVAVLWAYASLGSPAAPAALGAAAAKTAAALREPGRATVAGGGPSGLEALSLYADL
ncbi:hypothetical protein MNEG_12002 [Monoraphidium neglectum]|uniref:Uncharacterized protein n=1 Tax=Monoraphidium neglectum TaxID=145388 RepID=A0A0D2M3P6_9CHLO|nr:hypothetical protein MNEG_12002 [Monoraphidium neglectum]KIY95961.1 hypothetical protein MNEG_12002 [Monoraphidium neglectum]|eukprot:XP_013894981.1 hypothetical protein MNEG_12002 [Monoraphidium neglectum]